MREIYGKAAKERQKVRKGKQAGATKENLPELSEGRSRDVVGKAVGVSGKSIDYAAKVLATGVPELAKAVDAGELSVNAATSRP